MFPPFFFFSITSDLVLTDFSTRGATAKEAEASNFFKEVPKIFKSFKWMYIFCVSCIGGMIYLGCFAPRGWEIVGVEATLPMGVMMASHVLLPVSFTFFLPAT